MPGPAPAAAEAVAFRAGGGRKKVEEAAEAKVVLSELASKIFRFGERLATLAEQEAGSSSSSHARWEEGIDHLSLMLCSATLAIRERAAATIAVMAKSNASIRGKIVSDVRIIPQLAKHVNEGSLAAISALDVLAGTSVEACDKIRRPLARQVSAGAYRSLVPADSRSGR